MDSNYRDILLRSKDTINVISNFLLLLNHKDRSSDLKFYINYSKDHSNIKRQNEANISLPKKTANY